MRSIAHLESAGAMTTAINYDSDSEVLDSGDSLEVKIDVSHRHAKFVKITEHDGTIRLVPFELLDDAERAIMENRQLYADTRAGLADFAAGRRVSSDWLFQDDE
jgi:hypothetical protein